MKALEQSERGLRSCDDVMKGGGSLNITAHAIDRKSETAKYARPIAHHQNLYENVCLRLLHSRPT